MPNQINFDDKDIDDIIDFYVTRKLAVSEIARHFECSITPILRVLRDRDVDLRRPGSAPEYGRNQKIIDLKSDGLSDEKIAKLFNMSKQRVNFILSRGY